MGRGPAHGYAIAEALRSLSDHAFDLPEGTLYPALHRLHGKGWLRSEWQDHQGRRRRVYQLTVKGQRVLQTRQREWGEFARAMTAVVGGSR